ARQLLQILLFAPGGGEHLISQKSNRFQRAIFVRADDVAQSESLHFRREEKIELLPPLRLNGGIGTKNKAVAFELTDNLQPENGLAGAGRRHDMELPFAAFEL